MLSIKFTKKCNMKKDFWYYSFRHSFDTRSSLCIDSFYRWLSELGTCGYFPVWPGGMDLRRSDRDPQPDHLYPGRSGRSVVHHPAVPRQTGRRRRIRIKAPAPFLQRLQVLSLLTAFRFFITIFTIFNISLISSFALTLNIKLTIRLLEFPFIIYLSILSVKLILGLV